MNDSDSLANDAKHRDLQDSTTIEFSDLPPETQSHHLLLRLIAWKTHIWSRIAVEALPRGLTHQRSLQRIGPTLILFFAADRSEFAPRGSSCRHVLCPGV